MTKQTVFTCDWCERSIDGEIALMVVRGPSGDMLKRADICPECVESLPGANVPAPTGTARGKNRIAKPKRESPTGRQIAYAEKLAAEVGDTVAVSVQINGNVVSFEAMSAYIGRLAPAES